MVFNLRRRPFPILSGLAVGVALPFAMIGDAQGQTTQLPGLIVTVPQAQPPVAAPEPVAPPVSPPPAAKRQPAKPVAKAPPNPEDKEKEGGSSKAGGGIGNTSPQAIVVLVNDEPITGFEVDQRARLLVLQANVGERAQENMKRLATSEETNQRWKSIVQQIIQENQHKTRDQIMALIEQRKATFGDQLRQQAIEGAKASLIPGMRKNALDELIDERLKLQEAKRLSALAEDKDVDDIVRNMAKRNNMTEAQFAEHLRKLGADINAMRSRFRVMLSWNEVVKRRFGREVVVNQLEIDRFVSQQMKKDDEVELDVQRIVLQVPGKLDQRDFAARIADAEKIRQGFKGCQSVDAAVGKVEKASVEKLGVRKAASFNEPVRTLLLNAKEGDLLPPNPGAGVVELYALCGRKVVTADEKARTEAANELRQKEFELLARRHLRNLRQDAHIEYR